MRICRFWNFVGLTILVGGFGTDAFSIVGPLATRRPPLVLRFSAVDVETEVSATTTTSTISSIPLSWDELSHALAQRQQPLDSVPDPVVTLYRDTNGWCPFCERVWVALRAKGLPYDEQLISLQNKPAWYKQLVPTTLVPAVLFHNKKNSEKEKNTERKIVWESLAILQALDDEFPYTPRLIWDTPEYQQTSQTIESLSSAGFRFAYSSRNDTLTNQDKENLKHTFLTELDTLDQTLGRTDGPFCFGSKFSGLDCILIPMMERWRYQMPLTVDVNILEGRPNIQAWFDGLDSFGPYADRVAGDVYSWTAVNGMFLRYFGGGEEKTQVAGAIQRSDAAAQTLVQSFAQADDVHDSDMIALEGAAKLISNHDAVIQDCTNAEPKSQTHLPRASDSETASVVLRYVASLLLFSATTSPLELARTAPLVKTTNPADASLALRTVASRLCVPRDMGAPAAKLVRYVLATVADRLENEKRTT